MVKRKKSKKPYVHLPHLPEDILIDIFSRLPTKVVGKFRCLSKKWGATLSSSQFIDTHWNLKVQQQENSLILKSNFPYLCTIPSPTMNTISVTKKIELEDTCRYVFLWSICRGLVLLLNDRDELYLVNPVTRHQLRIIPYSHLWERSRRLLCDLGYDIRSKDFKIVRHTFTMYTNDWPEGFTKGEVLIDVYSVRMGTWKSCGSSPYKQISCFTREHGAFLNGSIHWLAFSKGSDDNNNKPLIAIFDLADEVFRDMPFPPSANSFAKGMGPFVLRGCLCILEEMWAVGVVNLWMMKEYGVVNSWTKIATWQYDEDEERKPFLCIGDEEVKELLFKDLRGKLLMYNLKEQSFRDVFVDGDWALRICSDEHAFVDSLISPIQAAIAN